MRLKRICQTGRNGSKQLVARVAYFITFRVVVVAAVVVANVAVVVVVALAAVSAFPRKSRTIAVLIRKLTTQALP